VVLEFIFCSLPARSNAQGGVDALGGMERPVVNHFRIALILFEGLAINVKLDVREYNRHSVVMPFVITNLKREKKKQNSALLLVKYQTKVFGLSFFCDSQSENEI
jgi:hypothetical protein